MIRRSIAMLPVAFVVAGCASALPHGGPRIQRLSIEEAERIGVATPKPVTLEDIASMSRSGVEPGVIVQRIRETASVYRLNRHDIARLREAGVSQSVIDHMMAHQRLEEPLARERTEWKAPWNRYHGAPAGWGSPWEWRCCGGPWDPAGWGMGAYGPRGRRGYGVRLGAHWDGWR